MKINKLINEFRNHGWYKDSFDNVTCWQYGDAILIIINENEKNPIIINNNKIRYLDDVSTLSFNRFRLMIHLNNGEDWFLEF